MYIDVSNYWDVLVEVSLTEDRNGIEHHLVGGLIVFELEEGIQGWFYANYSAKEGEIAYIPEYNDAEDERMVRLDEIESGVASGYTMKDIENAIKEYGYERAIDAETLLSMIDWQSPESLLGELEPDDFMEDEE